MCACPTLPVRAHESFRSKLHNERNSLFVFTNTLERLVIRLLIHELPFFITLNPAIVMRIVNLISIPDRSASSSALWRISCHIASI